MNPRPLASPPPLGPPLVSGPIVGNPARERRRAAVALAKLSIRRRSNFHGWLQTALLRKHALTSCCCGLVNCR
jgi:hypothetical protein